MPSFRLFSVIAAVGMTLAIVPAASAERFTVNSPGDQSDADTTDGLCLTSGGQCTLRAAVEQSNSATSAGLDNVKFTAGVAGSDIIVHDPQIPNIVQPLNVDGCSSNTSSPKPCVGISTDPAGPIGGTDGLGITADDVVIRGIAFHHLDLGIFYGGGSDRLIARNNWFGLKLDGSLDAVGKGIQVTGATAKIGGTSPSQRNVFAGFTGITIFVGDDNLVQGNYFGTLPNGVDSGSSFEDIEMRSNDPAFAQNNTIGGTLDAAAAATPECDGACNVIGGATSQGIDLAGSNAGSAARATTIRGNHIGVNALGTGTVGNAVEGVRVGLATSTIIGGSTAADRNLIAGNGTGVTGGGGSLLVRNNFFGLNPNGTVALPNTTADANLTSAAGAVATVQENRFGGNGTNPTNGVKLGGTAGKVIGNVLGVGTGGQLLGFANAPIVVTGSGHAIGQAGGGNTIARAGGGAAVLLDGADSTKVEANFIGQDSSNTILGNSAAGVRLQNDADNNTIGGGSSTQNSISNNQSRPGIAIAGSSSAGNSIGRNLGIGNSLFIDLGVNGIGNPPTGPNGGAQAPAITTATTTSASGTAPAGATVRVFEVGPTLGPVIEFLGQTTANGSGNWTLAYAAQSPGTKVSATQTLSNNTSELTSPSVTVS